MEKDSESEKNSKERFTEIINVLHNKLYTEGLDDETIKIIANNADKIAYLVFERGHEPTYWFLSNFMLKYPDLFGEHFADKIAYHAFEKNNSDAYELLTDFASNHPDLFRKHFSHHIANNADKIIYHAFEQGHEDAYDLLLTLARNHPDLFREHLSYRVISRAFTPDDIYAYQFLLGIARSYPDLFRKYFLNNDTILKKVEDIVNTESAATSIHALTKFFKLLKEASPVLSEDYPSSASHALLMLVHNIVKKGLPVTKELLRTLSRYTDWKIVRVLHRLGSARGWYLNTLLRDPELLAFYLHHAARIEGGKRVYRKLFEVLPYVRVAYDLGIDTVTPLTPNIDKYREKLTEKIKEQVKEIPAPELHKIVERNIQTLPSVLAYYQLHYDDVLELLKMDGEELFKLKFGHYGLDDTLFHFAKNVNSSNYVAVAGSVSDLIKALEEEAKNEGLFDKEPSSPEEKEFLETLKKIYKEIINNGVNAKIDVKLWNKINNEELARKLGLTETLNKIKSFLTRKESLANKLKVAVEPEEHLHAMNVPGSCMRPEGENSHGALAVTGGPALVFYAEDPLGRVVGRATFFLYEGPNSELKLVPNYNYGHVDVKSTAIQLMKQFGVPVHEDVDPPEGFEPAKSKFWIKGFWKDGTKSMVVEFK